MVDGPLDAPLSSAQILSGCVEGGEAGEVEKTPVNVSVVCIRRGSLSIMALHMVYGRDCPRLGLMIKL